MRRGWVLVLGLTVAALTLSLAGCRAERRLAIGDRVQVTVRVTGDDVSDLADYADGFCRYVVIADPTCAACQSAKGWWEDELQRGVVELPHQNDWRVIWAVTFPGAEWGADIAHGVEVIELVDTPGTLAKVGLRGVPAY